ncbi:MAG: nitroreductase family protein [Prevotella sp.]|nr:nitroreductase family protein [Prevotella sp.]
MKQILSAFAALLVLAACNSREPKAETTVAAEGKAIVENIMTRTSIRQYTNQAISTDTIEILLRAGMAAPTAVNKQPWHFVAITSRDKLKELAATNPNARMLEHAPLTIVVCGDMQKALEGEGRQLWIQDCSAATENILLAAHALGLGAVWTALYPRDDRTRGAIEVLKLPKHIVPLCAIIIGYPAEQPEPKDKWKPENVSYNEFGGKAE